MNKPANIIIIIIIISSSHAFATAPNIAFESGNRAYLEGSWQEALEHWQQVERLGYHSGSLYYNMGNAWFKLGETGQAILNWEKAAKLSGETEDIAANLKIARSSLVDKQEGTIRLPVWNWLDRIRSRFAVGTLSWGATLFCLALFLTLSIRRWLIRNRKIKFWLSRLAYAFAVILLLDLSLVWLQARDEKMSRQGILIAQDVDVVSAPAEGAGKLLFTLHEGSKVRILRNIQGWLEISTGKDKQGWVKSDQVGVISIEG
ncbi:MAG: hypothetical protein V2A61_08235 [Calditrichota bacterium]